MKLPANAVAVITPAVILGVPVIPDANPVKLPSNDDAVTRPAVTLGVPLKPEA